MKKQIKTEENKPDLFNIMIYCYGYVINLARDMDIYETIMYGDSLGCAHYATELYQCLREQDLAKELMEEEE